MRGVSERASGTRRAKISSRQTLKLLDVYESRNVTFVDHDGDWPIVWERARGWEVWTPEGRRFVDLTAAFGVAAAGHANPRVVAAGQEQLARLPHAMGDVHPHSLKGQLARALSRWTFERWLRREGAAPASRRSKALFCNSGFEAVEAALKTARLATGRAGVIAFDGGYHGVGYGALSVTSRTLFRAPFQDQLREFGRFLSFPTMPDQPAEAERTLAAAGKALRQALAPGDVGAILVEPAQARGGIRFPTPGFLPLLRRLSREFGALLVFDEIYTGFGRTGKWFAAEGEGVAPDLVCLGKALTGGFPLSACVGRAEVMDAWPSTHGEAIHTSTYLGNPVGCAMALAQIEELRRRRLPERAAKAGVALRHWLTELPRRIGRIDLEIRGAGLMAGVALSEGGQPAGATAIRAVQGLLRRGFIALPEGAEGEVIGLTPPLTIPLRELRRAVHALHAALAEAADE